jgi:HD-GYP domain-containing protein (c-di-GMP phosphodiesterase class II)
MTSGLAARFSMTAGPTIAPLLRDLAAALAIIIEVEDETGAIAHSTAPEGESEALSLRPDARWAPIEVAGERAGRLVAWPAERIDTALLSSLARDVGERLQAGYEQDQMIDRLAQCYNEIDLLYRLSASTSPEQNLATICDTLLRETADMLGNRTLVVYLRRDNHLRSCSGAGREPVREIQRVTATPIYHAHIFTELDAHRGIETGARSIRHSGAIDGTVPEVRYFVIPVRDRVAMLGFVGIYFTEHEEPPQTPELKLLACLAQHLSDTATRNELLRELGEMLFNTVKSLVAAIEAKDPYTRGHSERVYRLSAKIGERLGLPPSELRTLSWAALLHDIGKIAVPTDILSKPGPLTREEFQLIQTHPLCGCKVIEPIPQLQNVLPGIRSHHERVDGKGYPDGLEGDQIPFMARIIGVADTFDAMVSSRAYRRARTFQNAVEEVERSAGTQLDAQVVEAFLDLVAAGEVEVPEVDERLTKAA